MGMEFNINDYFNIDSIPNNRNYYVYICIFGLLEEDEIMTNIHETCENYNPKKDFCLKFFEENVSERYKVCREYSEFSDKELARKWSN
jgi:hypothetical protein